MPPPPYNHEYWKKYGVTSPQDPFLSAVRDLFVGHQKGTPTPVNLKRFWDVAVNLGKKSEEDEEEKHVLEEKMDALRQESFEDGRKAGFKDGRLAGLSEGKAAGLEEAKKSSSGYSQGYAEGWKAASERGEERGIEKEAKRWVGLGHSPTGPCRIKHSVALVAAATMTDPLPLPPTIPRASTAVQTDVVSNDEAESVTDYRSIVEESPLNWADDAESIPITRSALSRTSRNVNVLRTEGISKPFATLQRRTHRSRHITQKKRPCDSQEIYLSPTKLKDTTSKAIPKASAPHQTTEPRSTGSWRATAQPPSSALDWVHDARLFKLAHALQDLGWFLPQKIG